jgi:hypothetical protein
MCKKSANETAKQLENPGNIPKNRKSAKVPIVIFHSSHTVGTVCYTVQ